MDLTRHKADLRRAMSAHRDAHRPDGDADLLKQFCETALARLEAEARSIVSAYWPMGSEADVRPVMEHLHARGFALCLPVVVAKGQPLAFRAWSPDLKMDKGVWNIPVPPEDAVTCVPEALLVPLLAFDDAGYRLGYGGGFYDRTLRRLRAGARPPLAIGMAFECQQRDAIPHDERDEPVDMIVTEQHTYVVEGRAS